MVEDHKHCVVCGRSVAPEKLLCSVECENMFKQHQKRMLRMRLFTMAIFIALFLLILLSSWFKA
ncbi:MAG: DUF2116 family Zn-ribbon domain-containing protein [Candidatus Hodarchaeaceae archaeon]|nr:DUF2116 family Zn-ribbon domain-containing protein [Candidatus Hodarchaeaceae archaeon]